MGSVAIFCAYVKEVSELTGISIRTLRYYDEIGLLKPTKVTAAGYRLYDENSLKQLREIMFYREFEIHLSEIKMIMEQCEKNNRKILETQKNILEMKRNHLNSIIELISDVMQNEEPMSFEGFSYDDIQKMICHSLEIMSEKDKKIISEKYGNMETFLEDALESFKDEKACESLIGIYGSKEKAVEASLKATGDKGEFIKNKDAIDKTYKKFACAMQNADDIMAMEAVKELGESYKDFFKMDNAKALLLKVAKDYLNHSRLEKGTDRQYGKGITKYIGEAISKYYGEWEA